MFDRGFVTYSNEAKMEMLGVSAQLIEQHGAVSEPVAKAMVEGALQHSNANLAVSVTGIAGPSGGSKSKPVGTIYIAVQHAGHEAHIIHFQFDGSRDFVRQQFMLAALEALYVAAA